MAVTTKPIPASSIAPQRAVRRPSVVAAIGHVLAAVRGAAAAAQLGPTREREIGRKSGARI